MVCRDGEGGLYCNLGFRDWKIFVRFMEEMEWRQLRRVYKGLGNEENIRGGGKTVTSSLNICPEACCRKG
jgi:hypothetical protein